MMYNLKKIMKNEFKKEPPVRDKNASTFQARCDDQAKGVVSVATPETDKYFEELARRLGIPAQEEQNNTTDNGVIINGTKWATRNVDEPGTFAPTPESFGKFYQWNQEKAWNATEDTVLNWDWDNYSQGEKWEKTNDPSPAGWRMPSLEEIKSLLNTDKVFSEWVTQNGVNGRKFTDKKNGNTLFLPAVGNRANGTSVLFRFSPQEIRENCGGALNFAGGAGYYWSSAACGSRQAYGFDFFSGNAYWNDYYRSFGMSVRPVAEF